MKAKTIAVVFLALVALKLLGLSGLAGSGFFRR